MTQTTISHPKGGWQQEEIESILFLDEGILSEMLREGEVPFCIIPKEWKKVRRMRKKSQ